MLDARLLIANSALCALLAIYRLISNARSWNNCQLARDSKSARSLKTIRSQNVYIPREDHIVIPQLSYFMLSNSSLEVARALRKCFREC